MKVKCNDDWCRNNDKGECTLDEIKLCYLECENYDEKTEKEYYPFEYYTQNDPKEILLGNCEKFEKRYGNKILFADREAFESRGCITDGRTGVLLGYLDGKDEFEKYYIENPNKGIKKLEEIEKYGLSPIYKKE